LRHRLRERRRPNRQPEQPRVRVEQIGQNSFEQRSGAINWGFLGHTDGAKTIAGQLPARCVLIHAIYGHFMKIIFWK